MSNQLAIQINIQNDTAAITFDGVINEDSNFEKIRNLKLKKYIFNFDKIHLINSCGIRDWIKYLSELNDAEIIYENCPQIIIEQINMVHGFITSKTNITSFYAPYFCDNCDKEAKILLRRDEIVNTKAPEKKCPQCSDTLEFDALEKQYFHFLGQK